MIDLTIQIGCGGTGGILAPMLARLLAHHTNSNGKIVFVDGDEYEQKNVTRQLVGPSQIGLNKADALVKFCAFQGLDMAKAFQKYVNEASMSLLIKNAQFPLVICAVDNDATRTAVLKYLIDNCESFFWITPGNADDSDGTSPIKGQVLWYGRTMTATYGVNPLDLFPQLAEPTDQIPRAGSCANAIPSAPQLITSNALAAAFTLAVVQNLLDNTLPEANYAASFNARAMIKATMS
jgi:hypothetical protein